MRRAAWALALGAALSSAWGAAQPRGASGDAKTLYDTGRYADAARLFEAAAFERPGEASPRYNLGNALYKSGRLGRAAASYLRAYELDPRDEDIRFNLDFALRKAGESLYPEGVPRPLFLAFHYLSVKELQGLLVLALWLLGLAGGAAWGLPRARAAALPAALLGGLLALACGGWLGLRLSSQPGRLAVTVAPQTELRNGPGENFSVGFTAPEGRRVRVLDERDGWAEIGILKEGTKGWVRLDAIEKV